MEQDFMKLYLVPGPAGLGVQRCQGIVSEMFVYC